MDWKKVIEEIKATGMTQAEIADKAGMGTGTLSELVNGHTVDPRFSNGQALLDLHKERVQDADEKAEA